MAGGDPEITERGKEWAKEKISRISSKLEEMGLPPLSHKEKTEVSHVLESLPETCNISKMERKGRIFKKLYFTIECREGEEDIEIGEWE